MIKKLRPALIFSLFVALTLACSTTTLTSKSLNPSGDIVFQTDEYGNSELMSVNVTTKSITRLTDDTSNQNTPTYIAATKRIGYVSDQDEGWALYSSDLTGSNVIKVFYEKDVVVSEAAWSPDGNTIAVSMAENCPLSSSNCSFSIYTMKSDGSDPTELTYSSGSNWEPAWSPDGKKIAFISDRDGDSEIYVMDKDGSNLEQLTTNDGFDGRPQWSPDGNLISFETDRDGGDWDLYLMNADGSDPKPLTHNSTNDYSQSWSPDGNWIAYISDASGNQQIYVVGINGKNQIRLTNDKNNDLYPIWVK